MSKDPYFGYSGDKRLITIPEEILQECYYTFSTKCFYSFLFSGRTKTEELFQERDRIMKLHPKELTVPYPEIERQFDMHKLYRFKDNEINAKLLNWLLQLDTSNIDDIKDYSDKKKLVTIPKNILDMYYACIDDSCFTSLFAGDKFSTAYKRKCIRKLKPKELQVEYSEKSRQRDIWFLREQIYTAYDQLFKDDKTIAISKKKYFNFDYLKECYDNNFILLDWIMSLKLNECQAYIKEEQLSLFDDDYMEEDRFKCIAERKKVRILSSTNKSSYAVEKLYVPINNDYEKKGQIKLFD